MLLLIFLAASLGFVLLYVGFCGFVWWKALLMFLGLFLAFNALVLLVAWAASWFVDRSKPLKKQSQICRAGTVSASELLNSYSGLRVHLEGMEKLPKDKNFLLVCNHRSLFDPSVIMDKLRRYNIAFVSKPENLKIPLIGAIGYGTGCLPIDRENDRKAVATILAAANYVKEGICSVCIFPEGTRSRDGELLPFHAGSFKIAQKAGAPLVISSIRGTEKAKNNYLRRPTHVYYHILEVLPAEKVKSMSTRELARYSMEIIEKDLHRETV